LAAPNGASRINVSNFKGIITVATPGPRRYHNTAEAKVGVVVATVGARASLGVGRHNIAEVRGEIG